MSILVNRTLGILLAGGVGERLYPLTRHRAKPAVPFGGHYRIVDVTLSNCINSGLRKVFILTQYKSLSLNRHIRTLSHYDAKAHLVVARRIIDSLTPGWMQIGAVWLPLPHLIQLLPTQVDWFYRTGPFAVVDRVNVFEDEKGVHVSVLNPRSILRTVLMDDQKHSALIESHLSALRALLSGAVKGAAATKDYGEARQKGYIGKTMGVMAGGPFTEKVQDLSVVGGEDWKGTAERVRAALEKKGPKWGLHLAYALEIPEGFSLPGHLSQYGFPSRLDLYAAAAAPSRAA